MVKPEYHANAFTGISDDPATQAVSASRRAPHRKGVYRHPVYDGHVPVYTHHLSFIDKGVENAA